MKALGIIAEYDPFHSGHAFHIRASRSQVGEELPVICVMSGSWTQRGTCALCDKWTRAALALRGGVDLVLELPFPWAVSSAEGFARGAVETLAATGVVGILSFGSESGDLNTLSSLAELLDSGAYQAELKARLDSGGPFTVCRQDAARALAGEAVSGALGSPNDNLGVEYLRALNAMDSRIRPMAVLRKGADHDSDSPVEEFASASMIRSLARAGEWDQISNWTPRGTPERLRAAGVADMRYAERAILSRLRSMGEADFAALPDSAAAEGLPARLVRAAREAGTLEEFYALAKTKRYTHARLRRLAVWSFVGATASDRLPHPAYLRVLGFSGRGRELLREMKETASLPILTKSAHIRGLDRAAQRLFALECRATDLYGFCFPEIRPGGLDYLTGPVIQF